MSVKNAITLVVTTAAVSMRASFAQSIPTEASLIWSNPPDGMVDAARVSDDSGFADGIRVFELVFDRPLTLTPETVEVVTSAFASRTVHRLYGRERHWIVELSGPIPPGETTILSIDQGRILVHVHSRPGDVDGDLVSDWNDVWHLRSAIARSDTYDAHLDMDRNGILDRQDVVSLELALFGDRAGQARIGMRYQPPLTGQCCCSGAMCMVYAGGCPQGATAGTCPCSQSSCGVIRGG